MSELIFTTHHVTTTDKITLAAYTGGNPKGTPLVFVHGYPDTHRIWQPVMSHLAAEYFIVAYDVRGAGSSDRPLKVAAYKLPQLADDLWSVTTQILGDKAFHLIGHDWGSIQSWESACQVRFAERILSFTSISGPCLDHVSVSMRDVWHKPLAKLKQAASSWYIYGFHIPYLAELFWGALATRWHQLQKLQRNPTQKADSLDGMKLYRANIFQKQAHPEVKRAICPVHLIIFERDEYVTPILFDGLEKWVNNLTVSRLPLKHWDVARKPQVVAKVIDGYLKASKL